MRQTGQNTRVRGVALFVSMVLLLIMTLIGVAIMSGSQLQERMAGNQKRVVDATSASEVGVAAHLDWLLENGTAGILGRWNSIPGDALTRVSGTEEDTGTFFRVLGWRAGDIANENCQYPAHDQCVLQVEGQTRANGMLARSRIDARFRYSVDEVPLAGYADILCGDALDVNTMKFTSVRAHCDGDDSLIRSVARGAGYLIDSTLTSNGDEDVRILDRLREDSEAVGDANVSDMPVPPIEAFVRYNLQNGTDESFFAQAQRDDEIRFGQYDISYDADGVAQWTSVGQSAPYGLTEKQGRNDLDMGPANCEAAKGSADHPVCNFSQENIGDGGVLFCDGSIDFDGGGASPLENLTVISTCDITHNGRLTVTESSGDIVFYAGRDMTFNGASGPFVGRFFSGGDVDFNGNTEMTGQLIAEGSVAQNGQLTFLGVWEGGGWADTLVEVDLQMLAWRQLWQD